MNNRKWIIGAGLSACLAGCLGDIAVTFIAGSMYPGYSQCRDTMSKLGTSASPFSAGVSLWWVILGFLMIMFAVAFYQSFPRTKWVIIATLLIALYGLGEGMGSGFYKADTINGIRTHAAFVHDALGAVGVIASLILPLVVPLVIPGKKFRRYSQISFAIGIAAILLFLFRYTGEGVLALNKGLWQRIYVINYYVYLLVLAAVIYKRCQSDQFPVDVN